MRRLLYISSGVLLLATATGAYWLWPRPPALIQELRALPEVGRVEYSGPNNPRLTVIHLRDWHLVDEEACQLEGLNFEELLSDVEKVQKEQFRVARFLVAKHGLKAIYSEGLSAAGLPDWPRRWLLALKLGTPGRLILDQEVDEVLPLENQQALDDAKPVAGVAARQKAMVANLPRDGLALIVLGGLRYLTSHLPADTLYIRVTPASYPGE